MESKGTLMKEFLQCHVECLSQEHARKLLKKYVKKPFFEARCEDDSLPNIKWVLDLAKAAVLRHGVRGLVIDPYNELDHSNLQTSNSLERTHSKFGFCFTFGYVIFLFDSVMHLLLCWQKIK